MNVATIAMDRGEAREAYKAYRASVRERHSAEDEAIMRGYKELAAGHQVLNLIGGKVPLGNRTRVGREVD